MKKAMVIGGTTAFIAAASVSYLIVSGTVTRWFQGSDVQIVEVQSTEPSTNYDDVAAAQVRTAQHDPKIFASLQRIGYTKQDIDDLDLIIASNAKVQEVCGWEEAGGCLFGDYVSDYSLDIHYQLYVVDDLSDEEFDTFVAHEYLHYVWATEELERDSKLVDALYTLYRTDDWIKERIVAHYTEDKNDISTEIFSYGCTELTSEMLGPYLLAECNRYINTAALARSF